MNEDQGQRDDGGRAEEVNRAEDDSNPFDLLLEYSLSGLSRGSFVRALT